MSCRPLCVPARSQQTRKQMRSIRQAVSIAAATLFVLLPAHTRAQQQDVVIRGGWRFDTAKETMVRNTGIVVRDGTFIEVGANLQGRDLSKAKVVDLKDDEYILPGLFDMHGHYNVDLFGKGRVDE